MNKTRVKQGGFGRFFPPCHEGDFGLKLLHLRNTDDTLNPGFWTEAQCVHSYCSAVRFQGGCLKIPLAPRYFINEKDPYYGSGADPAGEFELKELFSAAFIENGEEILKEYENYKPVKEETLKQIYDKKDNANADLLMVYPMFNGGENNLTAYYNDSNFSSADARDLIVQILSAILDLYRSGRAHGDIKPENIMVQEIRKKRKSRKSRKIFRLTDFGSTHSELMPSDSGTGAFFNRKLYQTILDRSKYVLLARVYTDFYALVRTVLALALGRHPKEEAAFNPECVTDKWPAIKPLWDELLDTENITIERVRQIVSENSLPKGCDYTPFYTYVNDEFEEMPKGGDYYNGISYGRLHEQISFSNEFDPMMKISGISFDSSVYDLFPEFYHLPLMEGWRWMIFHAPDDAITGNRPLDFTNYRPMTLAETTVSPEEKELLKEYGRRLNKYFAENKNAQSFSFLPEVKHIFRVDGQLKLLWGIGLKLNRPIDYEKYFSFLAKEEVCFSYPDWRVLLPHI